MLALLDQPLPADALLPPPPPLIFSQSIRLEDVRFRYGQEMPEVLQGVNLEIRRGERIGLIGSTGSHILGLPRNVALQLLENHPVLYPVVLKIEAHRFRAALNLQQHNLVRERPRRVAGLLLMLFEMSGDGRRSNIIRLTSQQLAKMAHCSRQSLFAAVKNLTKQGAVKQRYGEIEITDIQKLRSVYRGAAR